MYCADNSNDKSLEGFLHTGTGMPSYFRKRRHHSLAIMFSQRALRVLRVHGQLVQ